ncbi:MAG: zinc-binding alcohol dehydrogenase [Erysipelotrichaceae bacterium]|nr:zinc-binding alcohol dehydrogenase [Erysipelotrichaceae bacterium]
MKTKRVIIYDKEDVKIVEEELGELNQGQALIEAEYSLISAGTELSRVFKLKKGATYPVYPGYSAVGTVLESKIDGYNPGDRVLYSGTHASVHNYDPFKSDGGLFFKLKPETDGKKAPFMSMAWIAMNAILPADVKIGDTVAIFGLGTLGVFSALYYQKMGSRVICFEPNKDRAKLAGEMGVKEIIDCAPADQIKEFRTRVTQDGADISVDASGVSACIESAIEITGKYGQVLLLGSPRVEYQDNVSVPFYSIHSKDLKVYGALNQMYSYRSVPGTRINKQRYLGLIEDMINEGYLPVEKLVSHVIEPDEDQLLEAYRGLMYKQNEYTGVLIKWK